MAGGGAYVLVLRLESPRRLSVGSLGTLDLPAGAYAYAAGARTGLDKRVERHRARGKAVVSHADALAEVADVVGDARFYGADGCEAATHVARGAGAVPVIGFGTSGCACLTHLFAFPERAAEDVLAHARAWRP